MHERSQDEINAMLKAITVTYEGSGLRGAKVYHGSSESQRARIVAGPENLAADGLGGCGLYVTVGDKYLASLYFKGTASDKDLLLVGYLNPGKQFRIARIQLAHGDRLPDFTRGIFKSNWQRKDPALQKLLLEHFDIIDLYVYNSLGHSQVLVVHESAGKDAIQWVGHYKFPVAIPNSSEKPANLLIKSLESTNTLPTVRQPSNLIKTPSLSSPEQLQITWQPYNNLVPTKNSGHPCTDPRGFSSHTRYNGSHIKFVHCEYKGPIAINGHTQYMHMWGTRIYERSGTGGFKFKEWVNCGGEFNSLPLWQKSSKLFEFGQKITLWGKPILKAFHFVATPVALTHDIMNANQFYNDISRATVHGSSYFIMDTSSELGIYCVNIPAGILYSLVSRAATLLPNRSQADIECLIDEVNTRMLPYYPIHSMGIRVSYAIKEGIEKWKGKIHEVAGDITATPQGQAAARTIDRAFKNLNKHQMIFVPGASCPVMWNPKKNNEPEVTTASPPTPGADLDKFFNHFDPVPLNLPVQLQIPAAPWEIKQNYFKEPIPKPPIIPQDLAKSSPGVFYDKYNSRQAPKEIVRSPFDIRQVRPIVTQRGAGLSACLGATGNLSVLVSKYGEGVLELTVFFDAQFWPTLFTGIGVGALIAGTALTIQLLINRHLKHLQEKINRTLKHSRKEQAHINSLIFGLTKKFNSTESKTSKDYEVLIYEMDMAIQDLQRKIHAELGRAEKVHEWQGKAAKPHNLLAIDYQDRLGGLEEMKSRLELDHIRVKFVENNEKKSSHELITLGKQLTNQAAYTKEDTAKLDGLKQLLSAEIIKYVAQGQLEKAHTLDLDSNSIKYYAPGNLKELKFDILLGVVDAKAGTILDQINQKISGINTAIGAGKNPTPLINDLIKHIESDADVVNNFLHRCHNRHHAHDNASVKYVSEAQWHGRINDVNSFVAYLKKELKNYENGNVPISLSSNPISKSLQYLQQNKAESTNFWFAELERNKVGENAQQTEEQLIMYVGSIASIKECANNRAKCGFNREAAKILRELKAKTNEDLDESINRMDFRHGGQIVNTLVKPFQEMAERFIKGSEPSRQKTVAQWIFAALNTLQIAVPNALSLIMQAVDAEFNGNEKTSRAELQDIKKQMFEDVLSLQKGWMVKQQLFFKGANYITENWLPERHQLQSRNVLAYGHALSRWATVGNTLIQVKNIGFNANIAQQALTVIQPVYELSMSRYHDSLASRGYDIEDPRFYKLENTTMPILQGLAGTLHMAFIHRGANRWTLAAGLAGILYAFYYYQSKATDIEANEKVLSAAVNNIKSNSQRKEILQYYLKKCSYKIILGAVKDSDLEKVRTGEEVLFVSSSANCSELGVFWIYLKGEENNAFKKKPLSETDNKVIQDLYVDLCKGLMSSPVVVKTDSDQVKQIAITYVKNIVSADEVNRLITASRNKIEKTLTDKFNGLRYDKDQSPDINQPRLTHFYCKIKDLFEQKQYAQLIAATNIIKEDGKLAIGNDYRLPPYFAWEVIVHFRLAVFATSEYLLNFRSQFDEYSKYIEDNMPIIWRQLNEKRMHDGIKNVVQYAMQQFILVASEETTKEKKLKYLSFVSINYFYPLEKWYETLDSDELKFWAAYEYNKIGDKEQSKLFLGHLKDIFKLLKSKCKDEAFVNYLIDLVEQIDNDKYKKLLTLSIDYGIHDNIIKKQLDSIIAKNKYTECLSLLKEVRDFKGKQFYLALVTFEESNHTAILESLKFLCAEKSRDNVEYWLLCCRILNKCLSSISYGPNEQKRLSSGIQLNCLIKTCINYIHKFDISSELRQETAGIANSALIYLNIHIQNDNEITKLLDDSHQCLSGEKQLNMFLAMEKILLNLSYEFNDNGIYKKFIPLDAPPDGDCLFHVLGITRDEGMALLRSSIEKQNFVSRKIFGNNQRQDVINILLDDLEVKNNTRFDRSLENQEMNIKLLHNYLNELAKQKVWMPYNQRGRSVLDALALLLSKNLRIFVTNEDGKLVLASEMMHHEQFETIDMLHTNAGGFSCRQTEFNHYIHLRYLPIQCEEVLEGRNQNIIDARKTSYPGFFKNKPETNDDNKDFYERYDQASDTWRGREY